MRWRSGPMSSAGRGHERNVPLGACYEKPVETLLSDTNGADPEHEDLNRAITPFQLAIFVVGSTIGTGIFFVFAQTVPMAGPAVIVSFILAGDGGPYRTLLRRMASMIPVSGSSYSYAYATLGEIVAFFVGDCLILEYGISAAAVAIGWSDYVDGLLEIVFGSGLPSRCAPHPSWQTATASPLAATAT